MIRFYAPVLLSEWPTARINGQRAGPAQPGTAGPRVLMARAVLGFVPGRRPRHGLLGHFLCGANPMSTAIFAGARGPLRERER